MPDLDFAVVGVEPAAHGLAPLLHFKLKITGSPPGEVIESVILQAQIQVQSPRLRPDIGPSSNEAEPD